MLKLILILFSWQLLANEHAAKIVRLKGDVNCFSDPSDQVVEKSGQVLAQIESKYYKFSKATLGQVVNPGDRVETGAASFAKLVYPNGDQFLVGPGTSYEMKVNVKEGRSAGSAVNLLRGKMRLIISKTGPRNDQEIKTKVASLGVRGTDFFVSQKGWAGQTKVAVMRGNVKVVRDNNGVTLKKGQSANVASAGPEVLVKNTTKEELVAIHQASQIVLNAEEKKIEQEELIKKNLVEEVKVLSQKSTNVILDDIKTHEPQLYDSISKQKNLSADNLNSVVIKTIFKKAPKSREKSDLEGLDLDQDYYQKYFNDI